MEIGSSRPRRGVRRLDFSLSLFLFHFLSLSWVFIDSRDRGPREVDRGECSDLNSRDTPWNAAQPTPGQPLPISGGLFTCRGYFDCSPPVWNLADGLAGQISTSMKQRHVAVSIQVYPFTREKLPNTALARDLTSPVACQFDSWNYLELQ